jgi:hypothetical protein
MHMVWHAQDKSFGSGLARAIYGDKQIKFGTVYLNYCEIGKTVEDLANDNDKYIGDDAF